MKRKSMRYERCIAYFLVSICRINAKAYVRKALAFAALLSEDRYYRVNCLCVVGYP